MHRPDEPVALGRGEEDVLLDVVEVLVRQASLILRERRVRLNRGVRLEWPQIVLEARHERDVAHGLFSGGRVEQVLQHATVDVDVLRLSCSPRPGGEEDVRRGAAAHGFGNRTGILEISGDRSDPRIEGVWPPAETGDLPPLGEKALHDVAPADARRADDEGALAHSGLLSAAEVFEPQT